MCNFTPPETRGVGRNNSSISALSIPSGLVSQSEEPEKERELQQYRNGNKSSMMVSEDEDKQYHTGDNDDDGSSVFLGDLKDDDDTSIKKPRRWKAHSRRKQRGSVSSKSKLPPKSARRRPSLSENSSVDGDGVEDSKKATTATRNSVLTKIVASTNPFSEEDDDDDTTVHHYSSEDEAEEEEADCNSTISSLSMGFLFETDDDQSDDDDDTNNCSADHGSIARIRNEIKQCQKRKLSMERFQATATTYSSSWDNIANMDHPSPLRKSDSIPSFPASSSSNSIWSGCGGGGGGHGRSFSSSALLHQHPFHKDEASSSKTLQPIISHRADRWSSASSESMHLDCELVRNSLERASFLRNNSLHGNNDDDDHLFDNRNNGYSSDLEEDEFADTGISRSQQVAIAAKGPATAALDTLLLPPQRRS